MDMDKKRNTISIKMVILEGNIISNQCNFKECHKILTESKANILIIDENLDARSNILMWIERTTYEEYKNYRDNGFNLEAEFPIEEIPVGVKLGSNTTKDDYEKLQTYIKEGRVGSFSHSEANHIISKFVPENVYDNWLSCMNTMLECVKSQSYGLHNEITYRESEVIIKIWYTPYNPNDSWPKISTNIYFPSIGKCSHDCLKKGDMIDREVTLIFNRESEGNGTIAINTDKGSISIPVVPEIDRNTIPLIQQEIKKYIYDSFVSQGGKMNPFSVPPNPTEHRQYTSFEKGAVDLKNFNVTGTTIKFEVIIKRTSKLHGFMNKIKLDFDTGEEKEEWIEDVTESEIECGMQLDLDYSKTNLENIIFCVNSDNQSKLTYAFGIDEFCISGKDLAHQIIEWLN
ncbi:hypothetical protein COJ23_22195 [Priestia megaterium]|uniref:hypothetical protein n=1 Tax=Priestia megaterium TaxID=1404 RepID=UPI000BF48717|nr:hypothetical protein [Priestia megaterium]PFK46718.1 hypothetical protein COJ23_22195 [Priestia megaterium]